MNTQKSALLTIVLDDAGSASKAQAPNKIQILRVGKWQDDGWHGQFEITREMLMTMVKNFNDKVLRRDVSFDYFHDAYGKASAWVKSLALDEMGDQLWAEVEWTPAAKAAIENKEVKYFSSEFDWNYKDIETGVEHGCVLVGGGVTNRPFVRDMKAIAADERAKIMTLDEAKKKIEGLESQIKTLSDENTAVKTQLAAAPKAEKVTELEKQVTALSDENKTLKDKAADAEKAAKLAEKKAKFKQLLSDGKVCAAQEEAYLADDMEKFMSLAEKPNLEGKGSGNSAAEDKDRSAKVIALAEEKMKADPKKPRHVAFAEANKEVQ